MADYVKTVIISAVVCGILSLLTPSGKNQSGRYIKYIVSLTALLIFVSPLTDIIGDLQSLWLNRSETAPAEATDICTEDATTEALGSRIGEICRDNFGIEEDNITVKIITNEENGNAGITEIQIYLSDTSEGVKEKVKLYFEALYGCNIYVMGDEN